MNDRTKPDGNLWKVRYICCGYEMPSDYAPTWEQADEWRKQWNRSTHGPHDDRDGNRVAIVERMEPARA